MRIKCCAAIVAARGAPSHREPVIRIECERQSDGVYHQGQLRVLLARKAHGCISRYANIEGQQRALGRIRGNLIAG